MAKNLITKIRLVLIPSEAGMRQHTELLLSKFFAKDQLSQPFFGHHLEFTTFSPWPGLPNWAAIFFTACMAAFK